MIAVAPRAACALNGDEIWAHALAILRGIGPHRPSLAVDLDEGRRTEIDALSGSSPRGRGSGRPAPVADVVGRLVGGAEPPLSA